MRGGGRDGASEESGGSLGGHYRPDLQGAKGKEHVLATLTAANGYDSATAVPVAIQPTQSRHPWRATVRTVFAAVVAVCAMLPLLVGASGLDETAPPIAGALAIAGGITRVMALPQVEVFLRRFLPFLSATPKE